MPVDASLRMATPRPRVQSCRRRSAFSRFLRRRIARSAEYVLTVDPRPVAEEAKAPLREMPTTCHLRRALANRPLMRAGKRESAIGFSHAHHHPTTRDTTAHRIANTPFCWRTLTDCLLYVTTSHCQLPFKHRRRPPSTGRIRPH